MTAAVRGLLLGAAMIAASCASLMPAPGPDRAPAPRAAVEATRAADRRPPRTQATDEPDIADVEVRELVRLVNRRRAERGCAPLRWHDGLARVAQRHSEDMVRRGFFGHDDPDGRDPFDRMRSARIDFTAAAENVAAGHLDAREVLDGWVGSSGHRKNLDHCAYTHHGIGLHRNRWTHVFARFEPMPRDRRGRR